ncbi:MAG: N-acetyltransferase family protein [Oscillospiraceae bacterium]|nr:N-acetyltransferase family protein [Oscillospiraceae bacterium]
MEYTVRPMNEDDWSQVVEIFYQGIQTNNATLHTACPSYEEWDEAHIKECRLVAELDGEVVGWTALSRYSNRECYKGVAQLSIYIDANYRGKGVGELLLRALLQSSEDAGFWTLQADIMQANTVSIRLHEKCGFRMVGYRERIAKDRFGVWRNTVIMEHRITKDIAGGCDCELVKAMQKESVMV